MNGVKVVRATFEGETVEGEYDVFLDGEMIGTVRRHDGTPNGYYGRWSAGRYRTDSRKSAVAHLVVKATAPMALVDIPELNGTV